MPDSDLNVLAVDTEISSDGYMPGLANPTTIDEIRDIYLSSQFPVRARVEQLQELRAEMVAPQSQPFATSRKRLKKWISTQFYPPISHWKRSGHSYKVS